MILLIYYYRYVSCFTVSQTPAEVCLWPGSRLGLSRCLGPGECLYSFIHYRYVNNGHVQPVGRPCGTWMHYAMRDVKDMGQQMGYRSLEWNWLKEAMNRPIWAGIVDGAKLF